MHSAYVKGPSSEIRVKSRGSEASVVGDCEPIGVRRMESVVEVLESELERPGMV